MVLLDVLLSPCVPMSQCLTSHLDSTCHLCLSHIFLLFTISLIVQSRALNCDFQLRCAQRRQTAIVWILLVDMSHRFVSRWLPSHLIHLVNLALWWHWEISVNLGQAKCAVWACSRAESSNSRDNGRLARTSQEMEKLYRSQAICRWDCWLHVYVYDLSMSVCAEYTNAVRCMLVHWLCEKQALRCICPRCTQRSYSSITELQSLWELTETTCHQDVFDFKTANKDETVL